MNHKLYTDQNVNFTDIHITDIYNSLRNMYCLRRCTYIESTMFGFWNYIYERLFGMFIVVRP